METSGKQAAWQQSGMRPSSRPTVAISLAVVQGVFTLISLLMGLCCLPSVCCHLFLSASSLRLPTPLLLCSLRLLLPHNWASSWPTMALLVLQHGFSAWFHIANCLLTSVSFIYFFPILPPKSKHWKGPAHFILHQAILLLPFSRTAFLRYN